MARFTNILVQIDTRRDETALLARAIDVAKFHSASSKSASSKSASLKIVDIVPDVAWAVRLTAPDYNEIQQSAVRQKSLALQEIANKFQASGVEITTKVLCGKSSDQVIGEVVRSQHDLVMKDAKGQFSQQPGVFGTTSMRLIRYCPCPVWAFRPRRSDSTGHQKVAVAVDATAEDDAHRTLNQRILEFGIAVAGSAPPHILHAWSVYGESLVKDYMKHDEFESLVKDAELEARQQLAPLLEPLQISPNDERVHLLRGDAAQQLTEFVNANGFDVLVMGTVARAGISGLLIGNTAESLLNRVECSVVAIKPADFKTPIHVAKT